MASQELAHVKNAIDATLGTGLVTLPFWVQAMGTGLGILTALAGLILAIYRIRIVRLEWQQKKRAAEREGAGGR